VKADLRELKRLSHRRLLFALWVFILCHTIAKAARQSQWHVRAILIVAAPFAILSQRNEHFPPDLQASTLRGMGAFAHVLRGAGAI
jgi:hypothetical protein